MHFLLCWTETPVSKFFPVLSVKLLCLLFLMHIPSSFYHILSLVSLRKTLKSLAGEFVVCKELSVCCGDGPNVSVL